MTKDVINIVNKLSNVEFCINKDVLNIIANKIYYKIEHNNNEVSLIKFSCDKNTSNLLQYFENKDFNIVTEITSYNSKHIYEN